MAYGMLALNSNGNSIIGTAYPSFTVMSNHTLSTSALLSTALSVTGTYPTSKPPIVAVNSTASVVALDGFTFTSGNCTAINYAKRAGAANLVIVDAAYGGSTPTGSYGIQTYDASGRLCFDSRQQQLYLVDVVSATLDNNTTLQKSTQVIDVTHVSCNTPYYALNGIWSNGSSSITYPTRQHKGYVKVGVMNLTPTSVRLQTVVTSGVFATGSFEGVVGFYAANIQILVFEASP